MENIDELLNDASSASETMYPSASSLGDLSRNPMTEPIPENSRTILVDHTTSRFSGAIWYNKVREKTVILAGLGGIGSYVLYLLTRLRVLRVVMYDNDTVSLVNLAGQLYSKDHIGWSKCSAMSQIAHSFSDYYSITAVESRYSVISESGPIMICGFDNMEARKVFYHNWREYVSHCPSGQRKHCLFIDGRLASEHLQVLCIKGDDTFNMERYERDWLFDDEEAEEEICSNKQTSFMANMIASVMINLFVNFCANEVDGEEAPALERDLPFLTEYDAAMMMFTTEA